jgi:hypothetical protein
LLQGDVRMMQDCFRLADLPIREVPFADLPYVRGHLDALEPRDGAGTVLRVQGWMAAPGEPIEEIEVYHNRRRLFSRPILARPDVTAAFPWLPYSEQSGFDFELPLSPDEAAATTRLDIVSRLNGKPRGRLTQLVRADVDRFPSPPEELMYRVTHERKAHPFKVGGLKSVGDFMEPLARHADVSAMRRILDWGCGCGRMSMFMLAAADPIEFAGCDIDPEAIAWNNAHLQSGAFSVLNPMPPTPYPSDYFDFIYSYSVFTHLTRHVQHEWLGEMLAPRGTFIATTHGQLAYDFQSAGQLQAVFPPGGVSDSTIDPALDGIAPTDYYRGTYQSKEYTLREFGRYFSILEYVERGATNLQDLIVLRKN